MIERIVLVTLFTAVAVGGFYLLRMLHTQRMATGAAIGVPTLLYFHSDTCAACPSQSRFIEQVAQGYGGRLVVEQVDAEADPETAGRYMVFTLPTTILLDGQGQVRQVNYGLADARKLSRQLAELEGSVAAV